MANGDRGLPAYVNIQPDDEYLDNAAYLFSSLRYCADSRKTCVPVKVVWTNPVTKQYIILFILLPLHLIAAIHYPCDSPHHGCTLICGEMCCKVWGDVPSQTFPFIVKRNPITLEVIEKRRKHEEENAFCVLLYWFKIISCTQAQCHCLCKALAWQWHFKCIKSLSSLE